MTSGYFGSLNDCLGLKRETEQRKRETLNGQKSIIAVKALTWR